jgi:phosphoglycolate phosphatase-like HAD superfamily hydrolase
MGAKPKIENIFWDFDGVIVESNSIREKGFRAVLATFPDDEVEALLDFHRENGGLSRYVKFHYFFEEIKGEEISEEEINKWAAKFSVIMLNSLKDKSLLIRETNIFIKENYKNYQMHIVSGSDQTELRELCISLEIDHFFKSIHGSPTPKNDLVKMIIEKHNYEPAFGILIGDSINDYEAAKVNDLHFQAFGNKELESKTTLNLF